MPNLRVSDWKAATVAKTRTSSPAVDMEASYKSLALIIPTIDSATVTLTVSDKYDGTFYPIYSISVNDGDDDPLITTEGTGATATVFPVFGYQFFKVVCGAAQTSAAVTFYARGFN